MRHSLGWDRARLLIEDRTSLPTSDIERFDALVELRARHVPLQHLTGVQEFYGRTYRVSPAVLIPRPETELLVEAMLRHFLGIRSPIVVDVGTGSGCIGLSVAAERPDSRVFATDVSPEALAIARDNARHLGLDARVSFHEGDLLGAVPESVGPLDAILCNPPYVDTRDEALLMPEVRDHEPRLALFPPGDAFSIYRRLAPSAHDRLASGGYLAVEVGVDQARAVASIIEASSFDILEILADLQGRPRVVVARRA